jgi:acetyl coenzyme A synthetase (ADP forming)-like protein
MPHLHDLFLPRSVAVIGASAQAGKIGYRLLQNILASGYHGNVYPINTRGAGDILGRRVYPTILDVEDEVDVACIAIPAPAVFEAVVQCARKGVKFVPIISSGFSEIGNLEEERHIAAYAQAHGMRLLGPNVFGFYSAKASLNATFGPRDIRPGHVAIITQSGALGIAMIGKTASEEIGLSAIVSIGNKADIDEADLLEYLIADDDTHVILMYIEGIKAGDRLLDMLARGTKHKPIIVIKAGRSAHGAVAAASHTGALAGNDAIFEAVTRQCGVLRAESLRDAFAWCKSLVQAPLPKGGNTLIITNGGGIGVMATDACEKFGVTLYDDRPTLKDIFSPLIPPFGSTHNPIDLTGQASAADYHAALSAALAQPAIHAVIALYCETMLFDVEQMVTVMDTFNSSYRLAGKPLIFSIFGGERVETVLPTLRKRQVSVFTDGYETVSCLGAIYAHARHRMAPMDDPETVTIDSKHIDQVVESARRDGRGFLLASEGQQVMAASGIAMPRSHLARGLDDAVAAAASIGYPVVMKIVSKDILHKSDVGGVALDLQNKEEVIDAYQAIIRSCRTRQPHAFIEGVEISTMLPRGVEIIVGARRDATFGPIVMFGLGGVYVEVMKDTAFRSFPLTRRELMAMMKETRAYPLLLGVRGEAPRHINGVIKTIMKLGTVIQQCRLISDIEINPLMVYEQGIDVTAVDVRVLLGK